MSEKDRYWTLVRLDPAGRSRVDDLPAAREFFQQISPTLEQDTAIQKQLPDLAQNSADNCDRALAELCLRCFISHQIEQACIQLETQFGNYYSFTRYDLFALVLDDDGSTPHSALCTPYQPLALQILQKFDPDRASLTTWTVRLVKHHHELNAFLLEHGLCMLSDWAILNDTTLKKLRRVLTQFHHLTEYEVQQATILLESYHTVYRRDRILSGQKGACPDPTPAQLQEISDRVQPQTTHLVFPNTILMRLYALAERLRQYRISAGGGKPPGQSLNQVNAKDWVDRVSQDVSNGLETDPHLEFLQTYRQQFLVCLETVLVQVIRDRLQTLKPPKHQSFLTALQLFYCQNLAMAAIAQQIGLQAQFQVSRLLKLDELRTDVRHWMLQCLRNAVQNTVLNYVEPDKLDKIDHQIAKALEEQVNDLIQRDQANSKAPKSYISDSLFSQSLCRYLDQLMANSY